MTYPIERGTFKVDQFCGEVTATFNSSDMVNSRRQGVNVILTRVEIADAFMRAQIENPQQADLFRKAYEAVYKQENKQENKQFPATGIAPVVKDPKALAY